MAIATPVLERKVNTKVTVPGEKQSYGYTRMTEDEIHNARIKDNFARLINPNAKVGDLFENPVEEQKQVAPAPISAPVQQVQNAQPYFVQNARANAEIFRADSKINRPVSAVAPVISNKIEEETEDERPTLTTIQYKTIDKAENKEKAVKAESVGLSKKERIIIAAFVGIMVMLFALIIINAAIISGLNADVSALQNTLQSVQGNFEVVNSQVIEAGSAENVVNWAIQNGWEFIG